MSGISDAGKGDRDNRCTDYEKRRENYDKINWNDDETPVLSPAQEMIINGFVNKGR